MMITIVRFICNKINYIVALFAIGLSISSIQAQNKKDEKQLPFPPDSIYNYISASTERLVNPEDIPQKVSISDWRIDLDYLKQCIENEIPYDEALIDPETLNKKISNFKSELPELNRDQRILRLYDILNFPSKGTGHFKIFGSQRTFGWQAMPFYLFKFHDATHIMSALDTTLIGKEITAINDMPINKVYKRLSPYVTADNQWSRETHVQERILKWANPLQALGIIKDLNDFKITIKTEDGKSKTIKTSSLAVNSEDYVRFLTSDDCRPVTPKRLQWSMASTQENSDEPFYRYEYNEELDMIYLQINILVSENRVPKYSDTSTKELAEKLAHLADTVPLKKFVIDLRTNEGGNTADGDPIIDMIRHHEKINKKGVLYTLISPITNSAAGLFSMKMEQQTKTIFAGQNGGFAPNIWGEISGKVLPNTKIMVYLSFAYYQGGFPNSDRYYITPEINIPYTSDQHFNNDDKTLKAVLHHHPAPEQPLYDEMTYQDITGFYALSPIHRVEITMNKKPFIKIDRGEKEIFLESQLYPITETFFKTDIEDLTLKYNKNTSQLNLFMKGVAYELKPGNGKFTLPLEYLRQGHFEKGKKAMKKALDQGILLGNDFVEYPLTNFLNGATLPNWPPKLSTKEKAKRALPYTKLSTELMPESWRTYANLALLHQKLGNDKKVKQLAKKILRLNVGAENFIKQNLGLSIDKLEK